MHVVNKLENGAHVVVVVVSVVVAFFAFVVVFADELEIKGMTERQRIKIVLWKGTYPIDIDFSSSSF